jgi:gliding motility-associated-like protein
MLFFMVSPVFGQDVSFHLNQSFLSGKKILKLKRDFHDPYLWVLARNNEIYRINSLTMAIDDYSAKFSAFHDFRFIDIAGVSAERVFLATDNTLVLDYNAGTITKFDETTGLTDKVAGIGISNFSGGPVRVNDVVIGTSKGLANYHMDTGEFIYNNIYAGSVNVKIFESTYRKQMFQDNYGSDENPAYFPTVICSYTTPYSVALYRYVDSGSEINTGFYTFPYVFSEGGDFLLNMFWGNDNGLYQQAQINSVFNHYLDGIPVNKITDIYGFLNFGNPNQTGNSLIRENLLIGTKKGFYYSSSVYGQYTDGANILHLFHYDTLGDLQVNDICVNATASDVLTIRSGCENGVWLGTDDGVYLLKPDFAAFLDPNASVKALAFDLPGDEDLSETQLCKDGTLTLSVNPFYSENNSIQWLKNGVEIPDQIGQKLIVNDAGDYSAILYNSCENVHIPTNHLKVMLIDAPLVSFNYPDVLKLCDKQQTVLNTAYNATYQYRWYKNDVLLNGQISNNLTVSSSGKYKVEVSACTNSWVGSKNVTVYLSLPVPVITAVKPTYCTSDVATLTSGLMQDPAYTIKWFRNGIPLPEYQNLASIRTAIAGSYTAELYSSGGDCTSVSQAQVIQFAQAPSFTFDYDDQIDKCTGESVLLDTHGNSGNQYRWYKNGTLLENHSTALQVFSSGKYKVEVSNCPENWIGSKEVTIIFRTIPVPAITSDKPTYCAGDVAKLSVSAAEQTAGFAIHWYRNQILLTDYNGQTEIHNTVPGFYTVEINNNLGCSQLSAPVGLDFNSNPTITIVQNIQHSLCDGETIKLHSDHTAGEVSWSTGENGDDINIRSSGVYKAKVTNNSGCSAETSINIQFNPKPFLLLPDATICEFTGETILITAPSDFSSYVWNGQASGNTYPVKKAGALTLTVTDQNGCTATQTIMINTKCADIHIPNTFTPNGDGFNDNWVIGGLERDASTIIRVFNRYGKAVYERKGNPEPWDGTYNSKKLPSGVYYYVISSGNGFQLLSGSLTIIY